MRILIIQAAKLGDMVCTTPMFRAVKKRFPEAELHVMGSSLNQELLAGNPHVDRYSIAPPDREVGAFLKKEGITAVIMTSPNPSLLWQALRVRVDRVIVPKIEGGFSPYATKSYRLLSLFATRVPMRFGEYMPAAYLRLLEPLGIHEIDTKKELYVSQEAFARARQLLVEEGLVPGKHRLIGIAPSAGGKAKIWPAERFGALAEALQKKYGTIPVITGTERDRKEIEAMREAIPDMRICDLSGKLSIEELKALVSLLDLFIAADTGPIYIAEALGVPTVDIVGPMDEREQPPQGVRHLVVVPQKRAAPAVHILNSSMIDVGEARRQAESIPVDAVLEAASALLEK